MSEKFDIMKALGAGTDGIDRSVLGLPFISIVQKLSPEYDKDHPKHNDRKIPDIQVGDIIFDQEKMILPRPITVIPLASTSLYTEWRPKSKMGGLIGHRPLSVTEHKDYRRGLADTPDAYKEWLGENELTYTTYVSVMFLHNEKWRRGLLAFTSTGLRHSRVWLKNILSLRYPADPEQPGIEDSTPPIFAATWTLNTRTDRNNAGSWSTWDIQLGRLLDFATDQALMEKAFAAFGEEQVKLPRTAAVSLPGPRDNPEATDPADESDGGHY